jgi:hypothetical protein
MNQQSRWASTIQMESPFSKSFALFLLLLLLLRPFSGNQTVHIVQAVGSAAQKTRIASRKKLFLSARMVSVVPFIKWFIKEDVAALAASCQRQLLAVARPVKVEDQSRRKIRDLFWWPAY